MLHACAVRFDVTKNLEKFLIFRSTKQGLSLRSVHRKFISKVFVLSSSVNRLTDPAPSRPRI